MNAPLRNLPVIQFGGGETTSTPSGRADHDGRSSASAVDGSLAAVAKVGLRLPDPPPIIGLASVPLPGPPLEGMEAFVAGQQAFGVSDHDRRQLTQPPSADRK